MTRITAPRPTRHNAPSHSPPDTEYVPGYRMSRLLGWFSIGLGVAELVAPRTVASLAGVENEGLLRVYGARELVCGVAILKSSRPTHWLWARVAGDALDLATLGRSMVSDRHDHRGRTLASVVAVGGVMALDALCAARMSAAAALEG